jgi:hypothetical protein
MPVTINGTTGISGIDGSSSQPSYVGVDTNTGIFFPAADTIAFAEGGAEAFRVDSSGRLLVGTTSATANGGVLELSGGITFPATVVAASNANTLDDYEEGTFTPIYSPQTGSFTTLPYGSLQDGYYVKIGKFVFFTLVIVTTGTLNLGSASGELSVGGLPFTSREQLSAGISIWAVSWSSNVPSDGLIPVNTTRLELYYRSSANGNAVNNLVSHMSTSGSSQNRVWTQGFYITD